MGYIFLIVCLLWSGRISAELPTELNPFMDKLFEIDECGDFISGEFTAVATSKCDPYVCDFPRQLCVRPSESNQDKSANICQDVPSECLTAANGGVSLGPPRPKPPSVIPAVVAAKVHKGPHRGNGAVAPAQKKNLKAICQMDPPTGRFCGFKVMYTYNKETLQCDEFWFPGCPTAETNANLFQDYQECQKVAELCKPTPPPFIAPPPPPTVSPPKHRPKPHPHTPPPPPPPPPPPSGGLSQIPGLGQVFGGGGMEAGPKGDGEDLGLLGLIQQGISSAQAIKQGGPKGKEAAAQTAGQLLQQFTGFDLNNIGGNFGNLFGG